MRFLADEGVDGLIVAAVRDDGHDVRWMAEELGGTKDNAVLEAAVLDARIPRCVYRDSARDNSHPSSVTR